MNFTTYLNAMTESLSEFRSKSPRRRKRWHQYQAFRAHLIQRDERMKLVIASSQPNNTAHVIQLLSGAPKRCPVCELVLEELTHDYDNIPTPTDA
jgi:hypothetical protein